MWWGILDKFFDEISWGVLDFFLSTFQHKKINRILDDRKWGQQSSIGQNTEAKKGGGEGTQAIKPKFYFKAIPDEVNVHIYQFLTIENGLKALNII